MSKFPEKLRSKGKVDEDRFFAKRDRELLKAMRKDELADALGVDKKKKKKSCAKLEDDFTRVSKRHKKRQRKLVKAYRKLLKRAKKI